jgi:cell wall-associated NlpC family hydrolase
MLAACAATAPVAPKSLRAAIVNEALAVIGRPYRYDAAGPADFDNSGLVQYVLRRTGIDAPRTAGGQLSAGQAVSYEKLREGDLLFYMIERRDREELHSGIYIGEGRMVYVKTGGRVEIEFIETPYWRKRYRESVSLLSPRLK